MENVKVKTLIRIGHGAYGGANAQAELMGKTKAVAELMRRGVVRSKARVAVNSAMGGSFAVCTTKNNRAVIEAIAVRA